MYQVLDNGELRDATEEEIAEIKQRAQEASAEVPFQVTMRQARLALLNQGKLDGVNEAIESLDSPQQEQARIEWEFAKDVERNSPIVALLAEALALSEEEVNALFVDAAKL